MAKIIIAPQDIERVVAANAPEDSNAMRYFGNRPLKNTTHIAVAEIKNEYGNIPVIKRGGVGIRPASGADISYIEPQPIEIDDIISAVEVDTYERATAMGKSQIIDDKVASHLRIIRSTTRALCAQSHRGVIDYMMQAGSAMVRYEVDYGDVAGQAFAESLETLTVAQVLKSLQALSSVIRDNGVGGPIEFIAGDSVFMAFVKAATAQTALAVAVGPGKINIGGFEILMNNDSWMDVSSTGAKSTKYMVEDREIMARAMSAGQKLLYLKLDDVVMSAATPFYSFVKDSEDQRGEKIFSKSKPFPLINRRGIAIGKFAA